MVPQTTLPNSICQIYVKGFLEAKLLYELVFMWRLNDERTNGQTNLASLFQNLYPPIIKDKQLIQNVNFLFSHKWLVLRIYEAAKKKEPYWVSLQANNSPPTVRPERPPNFAFRLPFFKNTINAQNRQQAKEITKGIPKMSYTAGR